MVHRNDIRSRAISLRPLSKILGAESGCVETHAFHLYEMPPGKTNLLLKKNIMMHMLGYHYTVATV
jgi:hypothetical protein